MSLDAILEKIHREAEETIQNIEAHTQAEVARILAEAAHETEAIHAEADQHALAAAHSERARLLQIASLEALTVANDAQTRIVEEVLTGVRERLARLRHEPEYAEILRQLIREALDTIAGSLSEGETAHVGVDARDLLIARQILGEVRQATVLAEPLQTWGGTRVSSEDGRVTVDNTLESRLKEASPYFRQYVPQLLRSKETPEIQHTPGNINNGGL